MALNCSWKISLCYSNFWELCIFHPLLSWIWFFGTLSGLLLAGCLAICTLIELLSMWNLTRIEVHLCNMLSPEAPQLSLASYNWCLVSPFRFATQAEQFISFLSPLFYGLIFVDYKILLNLFLQTIISLKSGCICTWIRHLERLKCFN